MNGEFYVHYNLLAKAQLLAGNKQAALEAYERSIKNYDDKENEAYTEIGKLKQ